MSLVFIFWVGAQLFLACTDMLSDTVLTKFDDKFENLVEKGYGLIMNVRRRHKERAYLEEQEEQNEDEEVTEYRWTNKNKKKQKK